MYELDWDGAEVTDLLTVDYEGDATRGVFYYDHGSVGGAQSETLLFLPSIRRETGIIIGGNADGTINDETEGVIVDSSIGPGDPLHVGVYAHLGHSAARYTGLSIAADPDATDKTTSVFPGDAGPAGSPINELCMMTTILGIGHYFSPDALTFPDAETEPEDPTYYGEETDLDDAPGANDKLGDGFCCYQASNVSKPDNSQGQTNTSTGANEDGNDGDAKDAKADVDTGGGPEDIVPDPHSDYSPSFAPTNSDAAGSYQGFKYSYGKNDKYVNFNDQHNRTHKIDIDDPSCFDKEVFQEVMNRFEQTKAWKEYSDYADDNPDVDTIIQIGGSVTSVSGKVVEAGEGILGQGGVGWKGNDVQTVIVLNESLFTKCSDEDFAKRLKSAGTTLWHELQHVFYGLTNLPERLADFAYEGDQGHWGEPYEGEGVDFNSKFEKDQGEFEEWWDGRWGEKTVEKELENNDKARAYLKRQKERAGNLGAGHRVESERYRDKSGKWRMKVTYRGPKQTPRGVRKDESGETHAGDAKFLAN